MRRPKKNWSIIKQTLVLVFANMSDWYMPQYQLNFKSLVDNLIILLRYLCDLF